MKFLYCSLLLGLVGSSPLAAARGVLLQNFQGASAPGFSVLGSPATAAPSQRADKRVGDAGPLDPLAADFARLDDGPTRARNHGMIRSPRVTAIGQQRRFRYGPVAANHNLPGYNLGCAADAYQPNLALKPAVERRRAVWYEAMARSACEAGVPAALLDGMIVQESGYNPMALSPKGAASLAQLMPARARALGVGNIWDPVENMRGGARYLRALLDEFGRYDLALAAYNAGEGRVRGNLQVPRIKETVNYVSAILISMREQLARKGTLDYSH